MEVGVGKRNQENENRGPGRELGKVKSDMLLYNSAVIIILLCIIRFKAS